MNDKKKINKILIHFLFVLSNLTKQTTLLINCSRRHVIIASKINFLTCNFILTFEYIYNHLKGIILKNKKYYALSTFQRQINNLEDPKLESEPTIGDEVKKNSGSKTNLFRN